MASKLEARGGPTNQLFAPWTLLGDTLPSKGTPQCSRGGPGRPNGGQGDQNGAKMEPKLISQGSKWRENGAPREPKFRGSNVFVLQFSGKSPCGSPDNPE